MKDYEVELRFGKEFIAEAYYTFAHKPKDYDRITRNKMLDVVVDTIKNSPNDLYRSCTLPEFEMLAKIIVKPINQHNLSIEDSYIIESLHKKLLLCHEQNSANMKVPDILKDSIKEAIKFTHRSELEKRDNYRYIILGLLRIRYFLPLPLIFSIFQEYVNNLSVDEFFCFLNSDNYLQSKFITIDAGGENQIICLEDGDYLEEIIYSLNQKKYQPTQKYSLEEVISIGKMGLNLTNKNVSELYEFVKRKAKSTFEIKYFIESFINSSSLGITSVDAINLLQLNNEKDLNKLIELLMNAHNDMPCWLNAGDSPSHAAKCYVRAKKEDVEPVFVNKIERNDPCPCGSGNKYKKCCLNNQKNVANKKALPMEDVKKFYELLLSLSVFTNLKFKIFPEIKTEADFYFGSKIIEVEKLSVILEKLWQNVNIIEEYIVKENKYLNARDTGILLSWKNAVRGYFILYKYIDGKAIVYSNETNSFYELIGVYNPLSESIPADMLPMYIETTLLPFHDFIIYDTVIKQANIKLGPNITNEINAKFEALKDRIIKTL